MLEAEEAPTQWSFLKAQLEYIKYFFVEWRKDCVLLKAV